MLNIIPFDYDSTLEKINAKWIEKGYDPNYAGSNIGVLSSILAYAISLGNTNSAYISNEKLLTQANNRRNILELSREIGYEAEQKISYVINITLKAKLNDTYDIDSNVLNIYEINRFDTFKDSNGNNWVYVGNNITKNISNYMITNNDANCFFNLDVMQGELNSYTTNSMLNISIPIVTDIYGNIVPRNYIEIPVTDVEQNGLFLFLDYVDKNGNVHVFEEWFQNEQYIIEKTDTLNKKFVRLQNFKYGTPRVYFNIGGVGNVIPAGSTCYVVAISSLGSNVTAGTIITPINFDFISQSLKITGQDEESIESIKINAPLFNNAANRAVTKYDYISIVNRQSNIDTSYEWGGEDEYPVKPGNVWFSTIPYIRPKTFSIVVGYELLQNYWMLDGNDNTSNIYNLPYEIIDLSNLLDNYKIMTIILNNRYPIYLDSHFVVRVIRYDNTIPKATTHTKIFNVVKNFMQAEIESFESEYFHSNLIKRIDSEVTDNIGIELLLTHTITLYKQVIFTERTNLDEKQIFLHFSLPFENMYDDTNKIIHTDRLPSINTNDFMEVGDSLYVDYNSASIPDPYFNRIDYYYPIKYKDIDNNIYTVGRYNIIYGYTQFIKVEFFIKDISSYELMHFNGDILSEFGNTWTGNGVLQYITADFIQGLIFDGESTYLTGPTGIFDSLQTSRDFTFEFQLRRDDDLREQLIFGQTCNAGLTGLMFDSNNHIVFMSDGVEMLKTTSTLGVSGSGYHHIAFIRNKYTLFVYLDGVLMGSNTIINDIVVNNENAWCLGGINGELLFKGRIDEFSAVPYAKWTDNFTPPLSTDELSNYYWQSADWTNSFFTYSMFNTNRTLNIDLSNTINPQRPNYKMNRNMFNRFVDIKFIEV